MEQCKIGLTFDPNFGLMYVRIGEIYLLRSNYIEAIKMFQKAKELTEGYDLIEGYIGYTYGLSGEKEKAEQVLNELLKRKKLEYVSPISIAFIYFGLDENDKVFEWLEKAYDARTSFLPHIMAYFKFTPYFQQIYNDPRYKAFNEKMNLPYE